MELNSRIFTDILSPLAAFIDFHDSEDEPDEAVSQDGLQDVPLGPHQAINNSLAPIQASRWRLDGIDIDGVRVFTVPTLAIDKPPARVDFYLPPLEEHSPHVRKALTPEAAMYTTDKQSAINLPISQHILQALDHWSSSLPNFETSYLDLPFGSRIVVTEVTPDPLTTAATIQLMPIYDVEQAMMSLDYLQQAWPSTIVWPETIDTADLRFRSQIHEAITLVHIPSSPYPTREYVFKSLVRDQKYLYNELKVLLSLPSHPNLIARPAYVVTHKCRFGGKRGVAGFILEYYPLGSLAAHLSAEALTTTPTELTKTTPTASPSASFSTRLRWARQITSALMHINAAGAFYPDLKPDNIVLRQQQHQPASPPTPDATDALLLDLEQRGGWFSWSPPEVAYAEYAEIVASRAPDGDVRAATARLLRGYMPSWTALAAGGAAENSPSEERYAAEVVGGFSAAWRALAEEREAGGPLATLLERAQTFMLGKLLWCVFEGRAAVRCGVDHELLRDPDPEPGAEFPVFGSAPEGVRELARRCTAGAPEWEGRKRGVVLRGGRLVPASWDGEGEVPGVRETREVARTWWMAEVEAAERFLGEIAAVKRGREVGSGVLAKALSRPLLNEVLAELERIERDEVSKG